MIPVVGMSPLSTVDWEGRLVATLFLQGCPLQCTYCHNADLIPFKKDMEPVHSWESIMDHMKKRRGLLDGIVFSGGDPCAHDLVPYARQIKDLGFEVGVHTSGVYPKRIIDLRSENLVDWIGLDFKSMPEDAESVTGRFTTFSKFESALPLVKDMSHEIRTTWHPSIMSFDAMIRMGKYLISQGEKEWVIQQARGDKYHWDSSSHADLEQITSNFDGSYLKLTVR